MKSLQVLGWGIATAALAAITMFGGCAHDGQVAPAATAGAAAMGGGDAKAQAEQGGGLYGAQCASCHGPGGQGSEQAPPVVGKAALPLEPPASAKFRKSQFRTARDVFDFVKANNRAAPVVAAR